MTAAVGDGSQRELVLCAVGDVFIDLPDPDSAFASTGALLKSADIVGAGLEGCYTLRPSRAPSSGVNLVGDPKQVQCLSRAGVAIMNCPNNHVMDGGDLGLMDTIEAFRSQGIATTGVGRTLEEARQPALLTRNGYRVAFLSYSSAHPVGYEARLDTPGLAPLRVHTVYLPPMPNSWNPGAAPDVMTVPHPPDLEAFERDIAQAREQADLVVVYCHWGDSSRPVVVRDYERQLSHRAIDVGADAVFAYHHHCLRGVELYQDKPIFYGLGAFALYNQNFEQRSRALLPGFQARYGEYAMGPRPGYPTFPFHPEYRMNMIARVEFRGRRVANVGLIPCQVEPDGHTRPYLPTSERGARVVEYLRRITAEEGIQTRYELEGGGSLAEFAAVAVRSNGS